MTTQRHGLSIGIERINNELLLSLKVAGKLTHQDYEVITPMLEAALEKVEHPVINAIIDATELEGWEARAAWDDFKLGVKHGREFKKIAIYGNKDWQKWAAKIGRWFIAGDIQYFEDWSAAQEWLKTE